MDINDITHLIISKCIDIHKRLGPGLVENVYEIILCKILESEGLKVERQKPVSFEYDGIKFMDCFRIDVIVDDRVILELKSAEKNSPLFAKQLLTYLRIMRLPVGLVINFGCPTIKDGLERVVNNY